MQRTACNRGFTLLEALITLTILCIVIGLAVPAFGNLASRTELRGEHDMLITALHRARGLAVETVGRVVVCPSTNGISCSDEPEWHQGWIVFGDDNGNREREADETLYEVTPELESDTRITSSRYRRRVGFLPTGMSYGTNATIRLCPSNPAIEPTAIVLSNAGRARSRSLPRAACKRPTRGK